MFQNLRRYLQNHYKKNFNSQAFVSSNLSTSTCALFQSLPHLDRLIWIESRGRNATIPGIMWKLSCFWLHNGGFQGLLLAWTRLWYHVKFVNHWYLWKYQSCRKGIMQWNNQGECTLNMKFMPQISNKLDKNCCDNHNINIHSLINNKMIIQ